MAKKQKSIPFLRLDWGLAERLDDLTPRLQQAFCLLIYMREGGKTPIKRLGECHKPRFFKGRIIAGQLTEAGRRERKRTGKFIAMFSKLYGWKGTPESCQRQFRRLLAALGAAGLAVKYTPRADFPPEWRLRDFVPEGAPFMKISMKTDDGLWIWEPGIDIRRHFRRQLAMQPPPPQPGQLLLFSAIRQTAWRRRQREAVKKESPKPSFPAGKEKIPAARAERSQRIFKNYSGFQDYLRLISISGVAAIVHYRKTKLKKSGKQEILLHHGRIFRRDGRWTWREIPPRQKRVRPGVPLGNPPRQKRVRPGNPPDYRRQAIPGIAATRALLRQRAADRSGGGLAPAALKKMIDGAFPGRPAAPEAARRPRQRGAIHAASCIPTEVGLRFLEVERDRRKAEILEKLRRARL